MKSSLSLSLRESVQSLTGQFLFLSQRLSNFIFDLLLIVLVWCGTQSTHIPLIIEVICNSVREPNAFL